MNSPNEEPKTTDNMELLKQQAAGCGAGCGCHSGGASGKARWGIGALVLIVAGVLVVRALTKTDATSDQATANNFAAPVTTPVASPVTPPVATPVTPPVAPPVTPPVATPEATPELPAEGAPATGAGDAAPPAEASAGTLLGDFAELNTIAATSDAVFVYLPGKIATSVKAPATAMQAAARTIEAKGSKCALFTLKAGSPDYDKLGPELALPAVLAMVKGKGMSPVTGEITETKLVQGYVAASSAGGCGSGACAPGAPGCN